MLLPRDQAYSLPTDTDSSNSGDDNNKTTQIIIGVVVGGVVVIAITAAVLFLLIKKRRWDRIRRYEERLLNYQRASAQGGKSRSVTPEDHYLNMMPPRPSSTFSSYPVAVPNNTTITTTTSRNRSTSIPEAPPPAYQTLHPRYDPSRYQGVPIPQPSSSTSPPSNNHPNPQTRSSRGLSFIKPITGPEHDRIFPFHGRRSESLSAPLPSALRPQSQAWYQPSHQPESSQGRPSGGWPLSTIASASENVPAVAPTTTTTVTAGGAASSRRSEDGPRRPKPILSRLITNF